MEVMHSSETSALKRTARRRHIPEDSIPQGTSISSGVLGKQFFILQYTNSGIYAVA
jgi:hypothetical protein